MTNDADTTQWSLPGPTDLPRDDLKVQLEVYGETILLRGFESRLHLGQDRLGGRDRQRVHPAPGVLLGAAAPGGPLVEPGRDRAGSGPVATAAGLAGGPATGGLQASRPAPASHAGAGLRLLAGPGALGLRRTEPTNRPRCSISSGHSRLQRLQGREGLPRKPPVPRRGRTDTGVLLPVLLLGLPETPGSARRSTPTTCTRYGRSSMERLTTRLRTLFPSARWPTRWRSPREDLATVSAGPTANAGPKPVGYLINHAAGLDRCPRHRLRLRSRSQGASTSSLRALT